MQTLFFRVWMSSLCLVVLLLLPSSAFAEVQTYEVDGYYTIGDGPEESIQVAKARALENAKGLAAQQSGTFVKKIVLVKNHQLASSEITTFAATVLQVKKVDYVPEPVGDTIRYCCHIVALVDDKQVLEMLSHKNALDTAMDLVREKDERIAELNRQMEELKRQNQTVSTAEQKTEIQRQVKTNENEFMALQCYEKAYKEYVANFFRNYPQFGWGKADIKKGIEYAKQAVMLNPEWYDAYVVLGDLYQENKEYDKAFAVYKKIAEKWTAKEQRKLSETMQKRQNKGIMQHNIYGLWCREQTAAGRDWNKKIEICQRYLQLGLFKRQAYQHMNLAYRRLGDYDAAMECIDKIIEEFPKKSVYLEMGETYYDMGEYEKAIECYDQEIAKHPRFIKTYYARSRAYKALGMEEEAAKDYAEARKRDTTQGEWENEDIAGDDIQATQWK